jgi:8-oxo-dGTP diphosphatase
MRAAALIIKEDKILLMHRKKEGREYWVFPGGSVEEGETPEEAVIREIMEELSLKAISEPELALSTAYNSKRKTVTLLNQ